MTDSVILPGAFPIRKCTLTDLDAIMALQETVCLAIENQELFVPTVREQNAVYLEKPNFILGCFDGQKLIAFCSFAVPGEDPENLGWDLGWPREKVCACAKLDTVVVHPAYRGGGLQRQLIRHSLALAGESHDIQFILTTVSPKNKYSLHNVQAAGFEICTKKLKYGGRERFILGRALA